MTHVLVGVDGSDSGLAALRWGVEHARARAASVVAMHAWQPPMTAVAAAVMPGTAYLPGFDDPSVYATAARAVVCQAVDELGADRRLSVDIAASIETGPAAAVLEARARVAAILVLGRGHRSALWRLLVGSVLGPAMQHVDCPVVIVPTGWTAAVEDATSRVLVAVADGPRGTDALRWASEEARLRRWPLVPLYVRDPARGADGQDWSTASELDDVALRRLDELWSTLTDMRVEPGVLVGEPGPELVRHARAHDLLVVGTRGRSSLSGWLLGSTSSYCAQHAACPVIVVRNKT